MQPGHRTEAIAYIANRAIGRFLYEPRRVRQWGAKTAPFDHVGDRGCRFKLYPGQLVDAEIFIFGLYEKRFIDLLINHCRGGTMLDIGTNIGNHAIALAQTFDSVHAFEPNPVVLNRLRYNIAANHLDDKIIVHPIGLGDTPGEFNFVQNEHGNLGGSGFVEKADDPTASIKKLRIENADEYIAGLGLQDIAFIKVDIEGWEPHLFRGLASTIAQHRPLVAFEFHAHIAPPEDFDTITKSLPGYILAEAHHAPPHGIWKKIAWNLKHKGVPRLDTFEKPEPRSYENILAFPDAQSLARFTG